MRADEATTTNNEVTCHHTTFSLGYPRRQSFDRLEGRASIRARTTTILGDRSQVARFCEVQWLGVENAVLLPCKLATRPALPTSHPAGGRSMAMPVPGTAPCAAAPHGSRAPLHRSSATGCKIDYESRVEREAVHERELRGVRTRHARLTWRRPRRPSAAQMPQDQGHVRATRSCARLLLQDATSSVASPPAAALWGEDAGKTPGHMFVRSEIDLRPGSTGLTCGSLRANGRAALS